MMDMNEWKWPVMRLCERQLRDINPNDILEGGLYRKCNIYKGGGGYDQFENVYHDRYGFTNEYFNNQFVVQLKGCPCKCPYCYVTPDGVWNGECVEVTTDDLVTAFYKSDLDVFHLMGGAPALYIEHWPELLDKLYEDPIPPNKPFHSDMLLIEKEYPIDVLEKIKNIIPRPLIAVSIKGADNTQFKKNTGINLNKSLFWDNFDKLVDTDFPYYLTFTGMSDHSIEIFEDTVRKRYGTRLIDKILRDSFAIDLIHYDALD